MIIYKCDACDKVTENDILPSSWSVLQVQGPQGAEGPNMRARHLCDDHTVETLIAAIKKP